MKLYDMGVMPSAYGNNPSTKYLVYLVPPASSEVTGVIANVIKALGVTANITPFPNLRPDEALVFVGRTPPSAGTSAMIISYWREHMEMRLAGSLLIWRIH
jgi:hypothetical protein